MNRVSMQRSLSGGMLSGGMLCAKHFMLKSKSCPALMHTAALVAPAAKPFVVVAVHVRPWMVDDAYLSSVRVTQSARGQCASRAKLQSSYSPRMRDPPPALEAPPAVEYETPSFFSLVEKMLPSTLVLPQSMERNSLRLSS